MLFNVYSLYDLKAKVFNVPFFSQTDVLCERLLRAALQDAASLLAKFPADYRCYRIGLFNDESGEIERCQPELVYSLDQLVGG